MSRKGQTADAGPQQESSPAAASPQTAVSGLMEERRRYEAWLSALEARRDETPAGVFARVHADYSTRLDAVIGRLTDHTEGLRVELTSLSTRLAELGNEQQQARDERAESELRAHVGELSTEDWATTAAASDARIEQLTSQHANVERELARARELLTDAERPATPHVSARAITAAGAAVQATVDPSVDAARESTGLTESDPSRDRPTGIPSELPPAVIAAEATLFDSVPGKASVADGAAGPVRVSGRTGSFDELAFLSSVVDTPASAAGGPPVNDAPAAPAAPSAAPAPSVAPAPPAPPAPAAPPALAAPAAPFAARRDSFALRAPDDGIENLDGAAGPMIGKQAPHRGKPLAANISGNNPIILKEKTVEGAKTLKCADCGAMNYPTEWYCERCGAELASL